MFKFFKKKSRGEQPKVEIEPAKEEKKLRISHTVYPDERLEYNEFWKRIYEEAKK
jgi:hypothetical protein